MFFTQTLPTVTTESLTAVVESALHRLAGQAVLFAPTVILALVLLLAFCCAAWLVSRTVRRAGRSRRLDPAIANLLAETLRAILVIFGLTIALGTVGVNVSALVAGLGLTGFALGFAFRDALSNVLAGVLILMYRPFGLGDRIAAVGFEGPVQAIDLRYTTIRAQDRIVLIPNATLLSNAVSVFEAKTPPEVSNE